MGLILFLFVSIALPNWNAEEECTKPTSRCPEKFLHSLRRKFVFIDNQQEASMQQNRNNACISKNLAIASGVPLAEIFKKIHKSPQRDVLKNFSIAFGVTLSS